MDPNVIKLQTQLLVLREYTQTGTGTAHTGTGTTHRHRHRHSTHRHSTHRHRHRHTNRHRHRHRMHRTAQAPHAQNSTGTACTEQHRHRMHRTAQAPHAQNSTGTACTEQHRHRPHTHTVQFGFSLSHPLTLLVRWARAAIAIGELSLPFVGACSCDLHAALVFCMR